MIFAITFRRDQITTKIHKEECELEVGTASQMQSQGQDTVCGLSISIIPTVVQNLGKQQDSRYTKPICY